MGLAWSGVSKTKRGYAVSSVARPAVKMLEKFRPSQKWDLRGVVAMSVSEVIFKVPHLKIVSPLLNTSNHMKICIRVTAVTAAS